MKLTIFNLRQMTPLDSRALNTILHMMGRGSIDGAGDLVAFGEVLDEGYPKGVPYYIKTRLDEVDYESVWILSDNKVGCYKHRADNNDWTIIYDKKNEQKTN